MSSPITLWFENNRLIDIKKKLNYVEKNSYIRTHVRDLVNYIQPDEIARRYGEGGKISFRTLIQEQLQELKEDYEVNYLGGNNNPVVQVKLGRGDQSFVCRFVKVDLEEYKSGISSINVREDLLTQAVINEVARPYFIQELEDNGIEVTYFECNEYYSRGTLEAFFAELHNQNKSEDPSIVKKALFDINWQVLMFTKLIINFLIKINSRDIWYTDLKPSNILIDDSGGIVLSDIKGLLYSPHTLIKRNRVNRTEAYFQPSIEEGDNQINLARLQCQTLATTIFQLATNNLPHREKDSIRLYGRNSNFNQLCFKYPEGEFLKDLIRGLYKMKPFALSVALEKINNFEEQHIATEKAKIELRERISEKEGESSLLNPQNSNENKEPYLHLDYFNGN
ncbi:MAG TPA: hypothetical protein PK657_01575 [Legionella sp.]|nr:hypothetical protein [Legionella sp.]